MGLLGKVCRNDYPVTALKNNENSPVAPIIIREGSVGTLPTMAAR